MPKSNSFNEVVTLDLKTFGSKHILWIIDSFSRCVQGKIFQNKRVETIVKAVMDMWILCFGIPSVGFYMDNGGEFVNVKMDKLMSRLGIKIRYGPAYSPWSNRINERNHGSCDITVKKFMEDKKVVLTDSLVKAASWLTIQM